MARYYDEAKLYADLIRDKNKLKAQIAGSSSVLQIGKREREHFHMNDLGRVRYRPLSGSFTLGHEIYGILGSVYELGDTAKFFVVGHPTQSLVGTTYAVGGEDISKMWLKLDGHVEDASGNNRDGTAVSLSYTTAKTGTYSADFNGTTSYISLPYGIFGNGYGFTYTIAFWVYFDDVTTLQTLYSEKSSSGSAYFTINVQGGVLKIKAVDNTGTTRIDKTSTTTVSTGQWYHIIWSDEAGTSKLYINGTQDSTDMTWTVAGTFTLDQFALGSLGTSGSTTTTIKQDTMETATTGYDSGYWTPNLTPVADATIFRNGSQSVKMAAAQTGISKSGLSQAQGAIIEVWEYVTSGTYRNPELLVSTSASQNMAIVIRTSTSDSNYCYFNVGTIVASSVAIATNQWVGKRIVTLAGGNVEYYINTTGSWVLLASVSGYNSSATISAIYVRNNLSSGGTSTTYFDDFNFYTTTSYSGSQFLNGRIDDFRVLLAKLDASQFSQIVAGSDEPITTAWITLLDEIG